MSEFLDTGPSGVSLDYEKQVPRLGDTAGVCAMGWSRQLNMYVEGRMARTFNLRRLLAGTQTPNTSSSAFAQSSLHIVWPLGKACQGFVRKRIHDFITIQASIFTDICRSDKRIKRATQASILIRNLAGEGVQNPFIL